MPAAVAKGIILSLSIIAALGLAVAENPQVQQWLEEQRKRIAELLRQIGEELDPQSRREAEAFAYEGKTVANDDSLRREASGSKEAADIATGRSLSNPSAIRRIPIRGPSDPVEAEERKRKGREYLARRNQQMYDLQQRRKAEGKAEDRPEEMESPPTPTFDELVDVEGKLKAPVALPADLPSLPTDSLPSAIQENMREVERQLSQPIAVDEWNASSSSGWQSSSAFTNPFSDEHALDRSITPKPPVPPKINLSRPSTPPLSVPGSFENTDAQPRRAEPIHEHTNPEDLSYEEQLAIALSLSEQDAPSHPTTTRRDRPEQEDDDLKAAIAASLKEMNKRQAPSTLAQPKPVHRQMTMPNAPPLIDLTTTEPAANKTTHDEWATMFGSRFSPSHESRSLAAPPAAPSEESDELYRLTPELTRARLATFNAQRSPPSSVASTLPFDPVHEAAREESQAAPDAMDASFHSAVDLSQSRRSSVTLDGETPQLIDIDDEAPPEGARTPTSRAHSSFGFQTDSDTETFASMSAPASRAQSRPRSEISNVEVVDIGEESDIDMLSEEGDGVATPDSWSEVGSRDADSEMGDDFVQPASQVTL